MPKDDKTDSYAEGEVLTPCYFSLDFYQKRKKGKYRLASAPLMPAPVADTHCHIEMLERPWWAFIRAAFHNVGLLCCVIDSVDDGMDGIKLVEAAYAEAEQKLPKIADQVAQLKAEVEAGEREEVPSEPVTIHAEDDPALCLDLRSVIAQPMLPVLRFIVGCHPHYAKDFTPAQEENLHKMLQHPRVTCVGEIGLDFHYDLSPRNKQVEVFKRQLLIAREHNMPVSLHLREAHDVALQVFDKLGFGDDGTLLHCFNLGTHELKPWVDADCYIALGGPVTFKKSDETREAVHLIPKNRLLSETDAPFMTPEPVRGDTCFPDHVIFNAAKLAEVLRPQNEEQFYNQLMQNARNLLVNDKLCDINDSLQAGNLQGGE